MNTDLLYEGKAKQIYSTQDPGLVRVRYKDDATAFNGEKFARLPGKGSLNNRISSRLLKLLGAEGVPTHFVKQISDTEQLVRRVTIIPLEVVVRNTAAGALCKRIGWDAGRPLPYPLVEYYYKDDALGDPLLSEAHIALLELASPDELEHLRKKALLVNRILLSFFASRNLQLTDFKLEFGKTASGEILLADEISPDTCRLWDIATQECLDKDRFRQDLGDVIEAYQTVWERIRP